AWLVTCTRVMNRIVLTSNVANLKNQDFIHKDKGVKSFNKAAPSRLSRCSS
ncbi:hypothetical protein HAX54_045539, partial [Datura stramonium]|nr:hypothetical protein [Datura stramonium]